MITYSITLFFYREKQKPLPPFKKSEPDKEDYPFPEVELVCFTSFTEVNPPFTGRIKFMNGFADMAVSAL